MHEPPTLPQRRPLTNLTNTPRRVEGDKGNPRRGHDLRGHAIGMHLSPGEEAEETLMDGSDISYEPIEIYQSGDSSIAIHGQRSTGLLPPSLPPPYRTTKREDPQPVTSAYPHTSGLDAQHPPRFISIPMNESVTFTTAAMGTAVKSVPPPQSFGRHREHEVPPHQRYSGTGETPRWLSPPPSASREEAKQFQVDVTDELQGLRHQSESLAKQLDEARRALGKDITLRLTIP